MKMKTQQYKEQRIKGLSILLSLLVFPLMFSLIPNFIVNSDMPLIVDDIEGDDQILGLDLEPPIASAVADTWWNYSWQYRKTINIQSSTDVLSDYQVKIIINLTEDYNAGRLNDTGKDIRFVDSSVNEINYWIEEFNATADGNTTIWVKVPTISNTTVETIYLYYGNMDASSKSDATKVFELYDDFESGTLNDTLWDYSDTGFPSDHDFYQGSIRIWGGDNQLFSRSAFSGDICVMSKIKRVNAGSYDYDSGIILSRSAHNNFEGLILDDDGNGNHHGINRGNWANIVERFTTVAEMPNNEWEDIRMWRNGSITYAEFGGQIISYSGLYSSGRVGLFGDSDGGGVASFDYIAVCKQEPQAPTVSIGGIEFSQLTITCTDIDGRSVPNAHVYISNSSEQILNKNGTTDENGEIIFINVPTGYYNITVNYTLDTITTEQTETLYYLADFDKTEHALDIQLDLWTIDFEVDDYDGDAMDYGYILVYNNSNADPLLANLTLGPNTGKTTFRWLNDSDYYYEVYFRNTDYTITDKLIESGSKIRENRFNHTTNNVNETAQWRSGVNYYSEIIVYADGSNATTTGKNRIIATNITLSDITDHLNSFDILYLSELDQDWHVIPEESLLYGSLDTSDNISIYIMDDYDAYGLKVKVDFFNTSLSNGIIDINFTQTTNILTTANISKLQIYTFDKSAGSVPIENLDVRIINQSGDSIVNLKTNEEGEARDANDLPFWYFHDDYNISLYFYDSPKAFKINTTDEAIYPTDDINIYNYTLDNASALVFNVTINIEDFLSNFDNLANVTSAIWGDSMFFAVNYTISDDKGISWSAIQNPEHVRYEVTELGQSTVLDSGNMNPSGLDDGNYSITLDSGDFIGGKNYELVVSGHKIGYTYPPDKDYNFEINPKTTALGFYNYTSPGKVTTKYNELINLTLSFNDTIDEVLLTADTFNYSWIHGSGNIVLDPLKVGNYYYFELNTSHNIGSYEIEISVTKENYSTINDDFILEIHPRPTRVNDSIDTSYTYTLDIFEARNFTLEYNDTIIFSRVGACEIKYYNWWKLDTSGARSTTAGEFGYYVENITETVDDLYVVDFDTDLKALGTYEVIVHLQKNNYEEQTIFFSITIEKREFSSSDNQEIISAAQVRTILVDHGVSVELQFRLNDSSAGREGDPLEDAVVTVIIDGTSYTLTESSPGVYSRSIPTIDYDTFFGARTLACSLTIEKENYESQSYTFNINVAMVEGPIPGIPTFYFLLIIGAIIAVVGSLTISRAIRSAKIPKFVKKANRIKGSIKSRKEISESDLYPSKEEFFVKKLGDKWDLLGISLRDIMGLDSKKGKSLPDVKDNLGGVIE